MPLLTTGVGKYAAAAGSAYTGPGDITASAAGWWGLRGYSGAYAAPGTGKAVTLDNNAGSVVDVVILSDGTLDAATAAPLIATHKVTKLWDQSGNAKHMNCSFSDGLTLSLTGVYHILLPGSVNAPTSGGFSLTQPFTLSAICNRVVETNGDYAIVFWNNNSGLGLYAGRVFGPVYHMAMNWGANLSSSVNYTLNTFTAVQGMMNSSSSKVYVDGTQDTGDAGTGGFTGGEQWAGSGQAVDAKKFTETGLWSGDQSANFAAMNTNMHTFWGF